MPEELWLQVSDIVQEAVIKAIPPKEKCKKAKWLSEEAFVYGTSQFGIATFQVLDSNI